MIDKKEIDEKSKMFEVNTSNVQRDYIFGWVLFGMFKVSKLKDSIFLKGGNALRKGYFENTRFSSDLDFGIPGDIEETELLAELNAICDFIQSKIEVEFVKEQNSVEEKFTATESPLPDLKVYEAKICFKDFYGNADHIKIKISMDVTRFDKVILPLQKRKLIHPYSDSTEVECEITCMKLEEIIATKLKCLIQRQHAPDLFDYVYSVKLLGGELDKDEVVKTFIRKTIFDRNPHTAKAILETTPFDAFKHVWEKSIICAKGFAFTIDEAITTFLNDLSDLFSIYPDNGYGSFAYFGSDLRTKIMQAGRTQTMLKINYNSALRIVEPYSLKYMERKDGSQREYFYVYNCSGGSNPPGVRCLVPEGFTSIENTEEVFTPRYQIELSKAGEMPENPYLFDPNKPIKVRTGRRRTRVSHGTKYVYQCSYCGKKFTRSSYGGALRPHKDKNGYSCSGRYGVYLGSKY